MVPNSFLPCFLLLLTLLPTDTATFSPVLPILPVNTYCYLQVFICIQLQPLLPEEFNRAGDTHPIYTLELKKRILHNIIRIVPEHERLDSLNRPKANVQSYQGLIHRLTLGLY